MYSLRRSRRVLRHACTLYKKKWKSLATSDLSDIEELLGQLDQAVREKNRAEAHALAHKVESRSSRLFRKGILDYVFEVGAALLFALVVATVVRQMWFEPMEIPSGSMRPTFQELDRLIATKTNFGLNIPLTTGHFYFNPDLVERTGVFIFTSEGMDIANQDTTYFLVFPGKRRLIKRCMGKPGDTLYFYGGKVYGVDSEGHELLELRESPWMAGIDAVPFITFEGKETQALAGQKGLPPPIYLNQMNQPVGRLVFLADGKVRGEVLDGDRWVTDNPAESQGMHTYAQTYGMENYAMARLLTAAEVKRASEASLNDVETAPLYLELRHNPSLTPSRVRFAQTGQGQIKPVLLPEASLIPLKAEHLQTLMDNLYTSRFIVQNGRAYLDRGEENTPVERAYAPAFPDVPDGRYQIQGGTAYRVGWSGVLSELPASHPLYNRSTENIQKLFNLGIEMNTLFEPRAKNQIFYPQRFAYYRNGDLYVMGASLLPAGDPTLLAFEAAEEAKQKLQATYRPFKDHGPPLRTDGSLDTDLISQFGLHIPEKGYLALGDNYASSGDSRQFGFVPEANIQGAPWKILWPPGSRWGAPEQKPYPWITGPRLFVWIVAAICFAAWITYKTRRDRRPTFQKRSQ